MDPEQEYIKSQVVELREKIKKTGETSTDATAIRAALLDYEKLLIERDKILLERDKSRVEKNKTVYTAWSVWISMAAIVGTIAMTVYTQTKTQETAIANQKVQERIQWDIKAAELLFATEDRYEFNGRLKVLKSLFKDRSEGLNQIQPKNDKNPRQKKPDFNGDQRAMVVRMIAAHPDGAATIVHAWRDLFPDDATWLNSIQLERSQAGQPSYRQRNMTIGGQPSSRQRNVTKAGQPSNRQPMAGTPHQSFVGSRTLSRTLTRYEFATALKRALDARDRQIDELSKALDGVKAELAEVKRKLNEKPASDSKDATAVQKNP